MGGEELPPLSKVSNSFENLLPYDGEVHYYGPIFTKKHSKDLFDDLFHQIDWKQDKLTIYGKEIMTKRKVAWYGDEAFEYTYSHQKKMAIPWTKELKKIKKKLKDITGFEFNSCLCNLYHEGSESMSWHADAEKELEPFAPIASISFGAARRFCFKHNETKEKTEVLLEDASLLVMQGETQLHWKHSLPKMLRVKEPRINLTFRVYRGCS